MMSCDSEVTQCTLPSVERHCWPKSGFTSWHIDAINLRVYSHFNLFDRKDLKKLSLCEGTNITHRKSGN